MATTTAWRIRTVLSCLAVDHRIGGLLLLDAPHGLLPAMARGLATALTDERTKSSVVTVGAWAGEDDLWLRPRLVDGRFELMPGLLVETGAPPIVVVPDLGRADVAVARAAVTLLDADTATAERYGWSAAWQPRARWLTATDRRSAAGLSPHLLDRFPLRIDASGVEPAEFEVPAPPAVPRPYFSAAALDEVMRTAPGGIRLSLALSRTAGALATLDGAAETTAAHVRHAAEVLGLSAGPHPVVDAPTADPAVPEAETEEPPPDPGPPAVSLADPPAAVDAAAEPVLYPETLPDALPEPASLRSPWAGVNRRLRMRGPRTGVERTRSRLDLAVMPTLLEAAKHRRTRAELVIRPEDWRRYRHGWTPHRLLVLVLDHTCRRGWDWTPTLAPYLQWAYAERAAVTVIDVGHDTASDELRAEHYRATGVRDPRVLRSLRHRPGRATPLAAGIDLAVQELLRRFRRSRAHTDRAWLVVVTDGRGNVPLEASARGAVSGPVGRQGADDAICAASGARSIGGLRTVVVAPGSGPYPGLPFDLADALGGVVVSPAVQP
ncbi:hypothetical protein [Micromonospora zamorensis]|uniref:hypothetical protein n=1 Tax=Micromonospora zamorensis TaxID=709883 RepID=UPI0033F7130C